MHHHESDAAISSQQLIAVNPPQRLDRHATAAPRTGPVIEAACPVQA
jgi:hypothetical protein